jgi:ureidoacrylate peracid hydrolase
MQALSALVDPSMTALVVVDVQNDFCDPTGAAGAGGSDTSAAMAMIPALNRLLAAARENGTHIVFVQTIHEPSTDSEVWLGRKKDPTRKNCLVDEILAAWSATPAAPAAV